MRTKTQSVVVTFANALAAETIKEGILQSPDKEFSAIIGFWVKVITLPGGNAYVNAGVSDGTKGEVVSLAPSELYYSDSAVKPVDKFFPLNIKNDGRTIKALVQNPILTTDALGKVVVVFLLGENTEAQ